jgi:hypothetical protein
MWLIRSALLVCLVASSASAQTLWVTANRVSVLTGSPAAGRPHLFASTVGSLATYPPDVWHTVDLVEAPTTTLAADVRGLLVITNASSVICDVQVTFRAPGDLLASGNYQMQAVAIPGDGARSNASVIVPVVNRQFQFIWKFPPSCGVLPSAVAINLSVQALYWNDEVPVGSEPPPPTPVGSKWFRVCDGSGCFAGLLPPGGLE